MESELEKYRRIKRAENLKAELRNKVANYFSRITDYIARAVLPENEENSEEESSEPITQLTEDSSSKDSQIRHKKRAKDKIKDKLETQLVEIAPKSTNKFFMYAVIGLKFLLWLFLYIGFLKIGFGAVYFIISSLVLIWTNTRTTRSKKKKEASAYSVFNPNCEALDGTLKAEHLEKQLLFRN